MKLFTTINRHFILQYTIFEYPLIYFESCPENKVKKKCMALGHIMINTISFRLNRPLDVHLKLRWRIFLGML